jgi:hypothetical protein
VAADNAPGVLNDGSAKQATDFTKIEFCCGSSSLLVCIGVDVAKDGDHFLCELLAVWAGIQAKKALIEG